MDLLEREIGYSDNLKLSTKSNGLRKKSNQRGERIFTMREKDNWGGNPGGMYHADEDELLYKRGNHTNCIQALKKLL